MQLVAPLFQLDTRDYNFTLIRGQIELHEKPKQPERKERAYLVASRLTQLLNALRTQNQALNLETKAHIQQFLIQLRMKVNGALVRQYPYSAFLYRAMQKLFSYGAFFALGRAEAALGLIATRDQNTVQLTKIDLEEKERRELAETHTALINLFELPVCKNEALLIEALKNALIPCDLKTKLHKKAFQKHPSTFFAKHFKKRQDYCPSIGGFSKLRL